MNGTETWQVYGLGGELVAEYAPVGSPSSPQKEYGYRNGELLITVEAGSGSGTTENVNWTNVVGATTSGNSITKTAATAWGNAGAASTKSIVSGDGYVEFQVTSLLTGMVALSHTDANQDYTSMEFALLPNSDRNLYVFESGINRGVVSSYTTADVFRVAVEGGVVKYRKNGALVYTSTVAPTYPLLADAGLYHNGGTFSNVVISGNLSSGGSSAAQVHWLVTDQLGTPRMVFDQSGSLATVSRHDYLPFGEELFAGTGGRTTAQGYGASDGVRQHFTQKERDIETGLDYFLARYYSSTQGRFTSPDEFAGGPDELFEFEESETRNLFMRINTISRILEPTSAKEPILFARPQLIWRIWEGHGNSKLGSGLRFCDSPATQNRRRLLTKSHSIVGTCSFNRKKTGGVKTVAPICVEGCSTGAIACASYRPGVAANRLRIEESKA